MQRTREISRSMLSYLKRAREHKEFLLKETKEFERGKRHLANMMGVNPDHMNQLDINDAIKYLFPSGLFDKKAWPVMKHPDNLYATQKDAQFDVEGRPYHYLFYTTLPNYYTALSHLRDSVRYLNEIEDKQLANGVIVPPDGSRYTVAGRAWFTLEQLSNEFLESIRHDDYDIFIRTLERVSRHPYSNKLKDTFDKYSIGLPGQSSNLDLPEIQRDEATGEIFAIKKVTKQDNFVTVKTVLNGTGKITIEGNDLLYFEHPYHRRAIIAPIQLSGMVDKIDAELKFDHVQKRVGQSIMAYFLRYAIAHSIAAYMGPEVTERLRLAGMLTVDLRRRERKKFGQKGARAKYTWKKR